ICWVEIARRGGSHDWQDRNGEPFGTRNHIALAARKRAGPDRWRDYRWRYWRRCWRRGDRQSRRRNRRRRDWRNGRRLHRKPNGAPLAWLLRLSQPLLDPASGRQLRRRVSALLLLNSRVRVSVIESRDALLREGVSVSASYALCLSTCCTASVTTATGGAGSFI